MMQYQEEQKCQFINKMTLFFTTNRGLSASHAALPSAVHEVPGAAAAPGQHVTAGHEAAQSGLLKKHPSS